MASLSKMATVREILSAMCAACLLLTSYVGPSRAATLQVSPILIQFYKGTQSQPIWLTNQGKSPLRAQVRVYRWTQTEEGELLEATNEIMASPPVMEVGAGQRQLLRIVRRNIAPMIGEESFRIIVDELPDPDATTTSEASALNFLLRYSIPAFISPDSAPSKNLAHQAYGQVLKDPLRIKITNSGKSRIRAARLVYESANGQTINILDGLIGYVLANKQRTWELPSSAASLPSGMFKMKIANDTGEHTLQMEMPKD